MKHIVIIEVKPGVVAKVELEVSGEFLVRDALGVPSNVRLLQLVA